MAPNNKACNGQDIFLGGGSRKLGGREERTAAWGRGAGRSRTPPRGKGGNGKGRKGGRNGGDDHDDRFYEGGMRSSRGDGGGADPFSSFGGRRNGKGKGKGEFRGKGEYNNGYSDARDEGYSGGGIKGRGKKGGEDRLDGGRRAGKGKGGGKAGRKGKAGGKGGKGAKKTITKNGVKKTIGKIGKLGKKAGAGKLAGKGRRTKGEKKEDKTVPTAEALDNALDCYFDPTKKVAVAATETSAKKGKEGKELPNEKILDDALDSYMKGEKQAPAPEPEKKAPKPEKKAPKEYDVDTSKKSSSGILKDADEPAEKKQNDADAKMADGEKEKTK